MKSLIKNLAIVFTAILWGACSTTDNLPKGETLYTGVRSINYTDGQTKTISSKKDSTGVIMAIAKTAKQMDKLLKSGASVLNGLDGIRVDEDTQQWLRLMPYWNIHPTTPCSEVLTIALCSP